MQFARFDAGQRRFARGIQLAEDSQRIGVTFVELGERQVVPGDQRQRAPARQCLPGCGERNRVEALLDELLQALGSGRFVPALERAL